MQYFTKYKNNENYILVEILGNFFWYHGRLGKKTTCELLERNGQFLVRLARSKVDLQIKTVLSVKWNNRHYHFGIKKNDEYFAIEELQFDSIVHLISFYFVSKHPLTKRSDAILLQPIYRYIEMDTPYILKGALNLAFACTVVIFLYMFAISS
ncbi:SH2 domain protein [Onchocerca flexuosa]|uniref:SH2 domain protein n=1 Tax=Onchocerca flexuosa TaxID=387005 RepID=A0A238C3Q0_9BILA|nr:SH2 domain protein [Onchocerca flexuosa]